MAKHKVYRAIGLMSGTSLDGVDAALIETDGYEHVQPLDFITVPYEEAVRAEIRAAFGQRNRNDIVSRAEELVTEAHIAVLKQAAWQADVIGFHGQTIFHAPEEGITAQIGNASQMAAVLRIPVIADFRISDVKAGGQGAPLAPLYHQARALSDKVKLPAVFLNIGGVANVTYVAEDSILAFDTGPGNALLDDWVRSRTGKPYDENGKLAAKGEILSVPLAEWLAHPYFAKHPPKSLDRDEWDIAAFGRIVKDIEKISTEDGAATLLAFTTETIKRSVSYFPGAPVAWYACGGGRHNKSLMKALAKSLPIKKVEDLGWNGDATEAECFAYLAVRSLLGEPISLPSTTGVAKPTKGGVLHRP